MVAVISSTDIATMSAIVAAVTPPIGAFLLVIKWIVNFQKEITDKYRDELREVRQEFDEYKLATEKKIINLESRLDALTDMLEEEQAHKARIINHLTKEGISLPAELERRKVSR